MMKVLKIALIIWIMLLWIALHGVWIYAVWTTPGEYEGKISGTVFFLFFVLFQSILLLIWMNDKLEAAKNKVLDVIDTVERSVGL